MSKMKSHMGSSRRNKVVILTIFCVIIFTLYQLQPTGEGSPLQLSEPLDKMTLKWYNYSQLDERNVSGPQVKPDSPELIKLIRKYFLVTPPPQGHPYHLVHPHVHDPSMGQSKRIISCLKNKTGGFFVECGALDGETRSNTLYFERFLGWNGLLIEADPINFKQMLNRKRHAWLSPTCLSLKKYPTKVSFEQRQNQGRISETLSPGMSKPGFVDVQCLPLYSLLLALNRTKVDYFSLDVEGHELEVLRTIPFDLVDIETLSVEFIHGKEGKEAIRLFMEEKGYIVDSEVTDPNWLANDFIFVKRHR